MWETLEIPQKFTLSIFDEAIILSEPMAKKSKWTPRRLRNLRERLGLKQYEAAAMIRVSPALWNYLESGRRTPNPQVELLLQLLDDGILPQPKGGST